MLYNYNKYKRLSVGDLEFQKGGFNNFITAYTYNILIRKNKGWRLRLLSTCHVHLVVA